MEYIQTLSHAVILRDGGCLGVDGEMHPVLLKIFEQPPSRLLRIVLHRRLSSPFLGVMHRIATFLVDVGFARLIRYGGRFLSLHFDAFLGHVTGQSACEVTFMGIIVDQPRI